MSHPISCGRDSWFLFMRSQNQKGLSNRHLFMDSGAGVLYIFPRRCQLSIVHCSPLFRLVCLVSKFWCVFQGWVAFSARKGNQKGNDHPSVTPFSSWGIGPRPKSELRSAHWAHVFPHSRVHTLSGNEHGTHKTGSPERRLVSEPKGLIELANEGQQDCAVALLVLWFGFHVKLQEAVLMIAYLHGSD